MRVLVIYAGRKLPDVHGVLSAAVDKLLEKHGKAQGIQLKYIAATSAGLSHYVYEPESDACNPGAIKLFDAVDAFIVYGRAGQWLPWDDGMRRVWAITRQALRFARPIIGFGFGGSIIASVAATGGAKFEVINQGGLGGELQGVLRTTPVPHARGASTRVFLNDALGDVLKYNFAAHEWQPVCNIGVRRWDRYPQRFGGEKTAAPASTDVVAKPDVAQTNCMVSLTVAGKRCRWLAGMPDSFALRGLNRWAVNMDAIRERLPIAQTLAHADRVGAQIFQIVNAVGVQSLPAAGCPHSLRMAHQWLEQVWMQLQQRSIVGRSSIPLLHSAEVRDLGQDTGAPPKPGRTSHLLPAPETHQPERVATGPRQPSDKLSFRALPPAPTERQQLRMSSALDSRAATARANRIHSKSTATSTHRPPSTSLAGPEMLGDLRCIAALHSAAAAAEAREEAVDSQQDGPWGSRLTRALLFSPAAATYRGDIDDERAAAAAALEDEPSLQVEPGHLRRVAAARRAAQHRAQAAESKHMSVSMRRTHAAERSAAARRLSAASHGAFKSPVLNGMRALPISVARARADRAGSLLTDIKDEGTGLHRARHLAASLLVARPDCQVNLQAVTQQNALRAGMQVEPTQRPGSAASRGAASFSGISDDGRRATPSQPSAAMAARTFAGLNRSNTQAISSTTLQASLQRFSSAASPPARQISSAPDPRAGQVQGVIDTDAGRQLHSLQQEAWLTALSAASPAPPLSHVTVRVEEGVMLNVTPHSTRLHTAGHTLPTATELVEAVPDSVLATVRAHNSGKGAAAAAARSAARSARAGARMLSAATEADHRAVAVFDSVESAMQGARPLRSRQRARSSLWTSWGEPSFEPMGVDDVAPDLTVHVPERPEHARHTGGWLANTRAAAWEWDKHGRRALAAPLKRGLEPGMYTGFAAADFDEYKRPDSPLVRVPTALTRGASEWL